MLAREWMRQVKCDALLDIKKGPQVFSIENRCIKGLDLISVFQTPTRNSRSFKDNKLLSNNI